MVVSFIIIIGSNLSLSIGSCSSNICIYPQWPGNSVQVLGRRRFTWTNMERTPRQTCKEQKESHRVTCIMQCQLSKKEKSYMSLKDMKNVHYFVIFSNTTKQKEITVDQTSTHRKEGMRSKQLPEVRRGRSQELQKRQQRNLRIQGRCRPGIQDRQELHQDRPAIRVQQVDPTDTNASSLGICDTPL